MCVQYMCTHRREYARGLFCLVSVALDLDFSAENPDCVAPFLKCWTLYSVERQLC